MAGTKREPVEFELEGLTFEFSQMPLDAACAVAQLILELGVGGPEGGDVKAQVMAGISRALGKLPKLVNAFVPYCKVEDSSGAIGAGRRVALAGAFQKDVFDGHIDRAILFVINCAAIECGDFLEGGIDRLRAGLEGALSRYPSLTGLIPGSGDLSSANT